MKRVLTLLLQGVAVAAAVLVSLGALGFAVLAFVFTAATSASDPNEMYEALAMFGFLILTAACIVAAWWFAIRRVRRQRGSV